jgi:hypothetical protein
VPQLGKARRLPCTYLKSYTGLGVGGGVLGVGEEAGRVAVGAAGRLVAVGGTVVGVGVSVTSGVGVTVGVSVAVGVGEYTGVGECVDVGVKVGLGVLVDVGVAVGDPMNDVNEQPKSVIMTSTATNAVVIDVSLLLVIAKPAALLSPPKRHTVSLTSQGGSWKSPAIGEKSAPAANRWRLRRADRVSDALRLAPEDYTRVLPFQRRRSAQQIGLGKGRGITLASDHGQ